MRVGTRRSAWHTGDDRFPALRTTLCGGLTLAVAMLVAPSGCGGDDSDNAGQDAGGVEADANTNDNADSTTGDVASDADAGGVFEAPFYLGADLTFSQEDDADGTTYSDNGATKPLLQLMKDHGFNYVRLRTFVDPTKSAPNPSGGTFPPYSPEGFGDLDHTVAFGQRIKAAGMGFLLDLHYSDYWADPGKQIKPSAWVNDDLAAAVVHLHDYTFSVVSTLKNSGARPDMVQVGNEITPGFLLSPGTSLGRRSAAGWPAFAQLLKAGIQAVHEVDPAIKIMLHLDRGGDLANSINFIDNAIANGVPFDVFGESCYLAWQGPPSSWRDTFNGLAARYPNLKLVMAEYNSDPADPTNDVLRQANDVVFQLPNRQGLGTFFWEPTRRINAENQGMFSAGPGNVLSPIPACIAQYDQMKVDYGL